MEREGGREGERGRGVLKLGNYTFLWDFSFSQTNHVLSQTTEGQPESFVDNLSFC